MKILKQLIGCALILIVAVAPLIGLGTRSALAQELYIGDAGDNSVKKVDLTDGTATVTTFVQSESGGLKGPMGLLFNGDSLLVSNQNVGTTIPGEILSFDGVSGAFEGAFVPSSDQNAPAVPRGIILGDQAEVAFLYVANLTTALGVRGKSTGTVNTYDANGKFLAVLEAKGFPNNQFHPRSVVFGPDDLLYVSMRTLKKDGLGGWVLRFSPDGSFFDVFIADQGGVGQLNRPEGLVFSPDGNLYITSFRAAPGDTDSIRIYDADGVFERKIDLHNGTTDPRVFAQALLFGPNGNLFVPIQTSPNPALSSGELRSYDTTTDTYDSIVTFASGSLLQPWYLTFKDTDPHTLNYMP